MNIINSNTGEVHEAIIVKNDAGALEVPKAIIETIKANEETIKKAKAQNDTFKAQLKSAMEEYGVEKITSDVLTVSYVAEHESIRLDSKKVQKEYPRIFDECSKVSPVKASVRVTLK
jgi:uncharacterized protein YfeS